MKEGLELDVRRGYVFGRGLRGLCLRVEGDVAGDEVLAKLAVACRRLCDSVRDCCRSEQLEVFGEPVDGWEV